MSHTKKTLVPLLNEVAKDAMIDGPEKSYMLTGKQLDRLVTAAENQADKLQEQANEIVKLKAALEDTRWDITP